MKFYLFLDIWILKVIEEIVNKEKFEMENSDMFFENKIKNICE